MSKYPFETVGGARRQLTQSDRQVNPTEKTNQLIVSGIKCQVLTIMVLVGR